MILGRENVAAKDVRKSQQRHFNSHYDKMQNAPLGKDFHQFPPDCAWCLETENYREKRNFALNIHLLISFLCQLLLLQLPCSFLLKSYKSAYSTHPSTPPHSSVTPFKVAIQYSHDHFYGNLIALDNLKFSLCGPNRVTFFLPRR